MKREEEEEESHRDISDRKREPLLSTDLVWLSVLLAIGVILRFYRLGWHSIWADEGGSILVAGMDLRSMFSFLIHQDAHPPLFFLILHYTLPIGSSELILRIPSAICGAISVILTFSIARMLLGTMTARIAICLMAFSAAQIYVIQEIRMYPHFICASLLATYLLLRAAEKPSWPATGLYCLSLVMALYTHYMALIVLLCHAVGVFFLTKDRKTIGKLAAAQLVSFVAFLPWISVIAIQQKAATTPPFPFQMSSLVYTFLAFFSGFTFAINQGSPEFWLILLFSLVVPAAMALSLPGGWSGMEKKSRAGVIFVLIQLLLPMAALALASIFRVKHLFAIKYITFTMPFYYILLSFLTQTGRKKIFVYALPAVFLLVNLIALHNWYFVPEFQKQRWKEAVTQVRSERQGNDAFLIQDFLQINCLEYYLRDRRNIFMIRPADAPAALQELLKSHDRIWYIASCGWRIKDPELKLISWLKENMTEKDVRVYRNIDQYADIYVILFERKETNKTPPESKER
jgi:uncharacterized membrane protein